MRLNTLPLLMVSLLSIGIAAPLHAQAVAPRIQEFEAALPFERAALQPTSARESAAAPGLGLATRQSHLGTGLLAGGIVGVASVGLFLAAVCDAPESPCGGSEYSRALIYIALPITAAGGLIGFLVPSRN